MCGERVPGWTSPLLSAGGWPGGPAVTPDVNKQKGEGPVGGGGLAFPPSGHH